MGDLIEYELGKLFDGNVMKADGLIMSLEEMLFALREGEAVKKELAELKVKLDGLSEITCEMKAECIGEFKETYEVWSDIHDENIEQSILISWPNTKDIYQMMLASKLKGGQ